jgi:hypothetical protein
LTRRCDSLLIIVEFEREPLQSGCAKAVDILVQRRNFSAVLIDELTGHVGFGWAPRPLAWRRSAYALGIGVTAMALISVKSGADAATPRAHSKDRPRKKARNGGLIEGAADGRRCLRSH